MNSPSVFQFQDAYQLRIVTIDAAPWFVAADIAKILEYSEGTKIARMCDDDEKGLHNLETPTGEQKMIIISQPGLFRALANSRSPRAKPFQRWLFHDVLPKIMATGGYTVPTREQSGPSPYARIPLTREELRAIQASFDNISRFIRHHTSAKTASAIYVPLHSRFGITSIKDMSAADLPAVLLLLETLGKDAHTFYLEQCDRESRFLKDMGRKVLPMPTQQELMAA